MTKELSNSQLYSLQIMTMISSSLSVLGCSLVLWKLFTSNPIWNITNKQLLILCLIDLVTAIFWGIGQYWTDYDKLCNFQGFMIQFGAFWNILWNSAIAYLLYQWIVMKQNSDKLDRKLKYLAGGSFFISLFSATFLLLDRDYGDAVLWCWIDNDHEWYRIFFLYFFLLLSWIFNAFVLHLVSRAISNRNQLNTLPGSHHLALAEAEIQTKLRQYLFVFILSWYFGLFNRLMQFILDRPVFLTSLLHAFFVPLQGFLNSVCYGDIFEDCLNCWKGGVSMSEISMTSSSIIQSPSQSVNSPNSTTSFLSFPSLSGLAPTLHRKSISPSTLLPQISYEPRSLSFFISTYNQGEATLAEMREDIPAWLPAGHDIYVIGVQECLYLNEFRQFIFNYLGGTSQFYQYTAEIGNTNTRLGFHGYIALTVFIRAAEIESNAIRVIESNTKNVKTGKDLLVATAPNKGAVGLSFHIHNTIVGFITAHFPSDSDGKSKMTRRNEVSQSVLQEVVLSDEDTGCDVQFQHDYLFLLGDFNYRLNPIIPPLNKSINISNIPSLSTPSNILFNVTSATFIERGFYPIDDTNWYQRKYRIFDGPSATTNISQSEQDLILRNEATSHEEWMKVFASDEMLHWMKVGKIFYGFKELPIRFPPTYKRKKGISGYCGDYTNYGEVVQGFSNLGDQEEEEKRDEEEKNQLGDIDLQIASGIGNNITSTHSPQHKRNRSDLTSIASNSTTSSNPMESKNIKPARRATIFTLKSESFEEKRKAKIRPPSYTDRIIYHSMCPHDGKLHSMKYGFCDTLRASDHRPVVMTMQLEVNKNILPSSRIITANNKSILNTHVIILQLTISEVAITLTELQEQDIINPLLKPLESDDTDLENIFDPSATSSPSSLPQLQPQSFKNIQVIFPISPKDPLLHYRKIYDLSKALHVNERTGLSLNHKSSQLKEELLQSKRIFPFKMISSTEGIKIRSCIDISSDVEAVLIFMDSTGREIGQGVLHLTPLLTLEKLNSPQLIRQNPLTSGGKYLGHFSAVCSLKHLPIQLSLR